MYDAVYKNGGTAYNAKITDNDAKSALNLTSNILDKTGPRLTGSKSCKEAGNILKSNLDKYCDNY